MPDQVDQLRIVQVCGCGDHFCQSFYTAPNPDRVYGDGHRNVCLAARGRGYVILDLVHDKIVYVEILYRSSLC